MIHVPTSITASEEDAASPSQERPTAWLPCTCRWRSGSPKTTLPWFWQSGILASFSVPPELAQNSYCCTSRYERQRGQNQEPVGRFRDRDRGQSVAKIGFPDDVVGMVDHTIAAAVGHQVGRAAPGIPPGDIVSGVDDAVGIVVAGKHGNDGQGYVGGTVRDSNIEPRIEICEHRCKGSTHSAGRLDEVERVAEFYGGFPVPRTPPSAREEHSCISPRKGQTNA